MPTLILHTPRQKCCCAPDPNPSPTPTPKPTNTRGCIIWQGAEFGTTPAHRENSRCSRLANPACYALYLPCVPFGRAHPYALITSKAWIKVLCRYDRFPSIAANLRRISVNCRVSPVLNVLNLLFIIILRP